MACSCCRNAMNQPSTKPLSLKAAARTTAPWSCSCVHACARHSMRSSSTKPEIEPEIRQDERNDETEQRHRRCPSAGRYIGRSGSDDTHNQAAYVDDNLNFKVSSEHLALRTVNDQYFI